MYDLFQTGDHEARENRTIAPGACLLPGFALPEENTLLKALSAIVKEAPFQQMATPGGRPMSVVTSSCGDVGWVTDHRGYRYSPLNPATGKPWPAMPDSFLDLAQRAAHQAGYQNFQPDGCLINGYRVGARLSLHQDKDERDLDAPIVSVSLGLPASFQFGGMQRSDRVERYRLCHGDVVVWGGPSRLRFHGVEPIRDGYHERLGARRINLTFRKVK
jgi:alkylated DNA repair protein (DNA oxidative demethylase)